MDMNCFWKIYKDTVVDSQTSRKKKIFAVLTSLESIAAYIISIQPLNVACKQYTPV